MIDLFSGKFPTSGRALVLAAAMVLAPGAMVQAKSVDDAVVDCMFAVKNSSYLSVTVSKRNGTSKMSFKKTKAARKDKVSKADLETLQGVFSACLAKKTGN